MQGSGNTWHALASEHCLLGERSLHLCQGAKYSCFNRQQSCDAEPCGTVLFKVAFHRATTWVMGGCYDIDFHSYSPWAGPTPPRCVHLRNRRCEHAGSSKTVRFLWSVGRMSRAFSAESEQSNARIEWNNKGFHRGLTCLFAFPHLPKGNNALDDPKPNCEERLYRFAPIISLNKTTTVDVEFRVLLCPCSSRRGRQEDPKGRRWFN